VQQDLLFERVGLGGEALAEQRAAARASSPCAVACSASRSRSATSCAQRWRTMAGAEYSSAASASTRGSTGVRSR